ncbi:MAG: hypothetical protein WA634_18205 [Silvibacterium sp.]
MSTPPAEFSETAQTLPAEKPRARGLLAWSSFLFALLQSICGAVVAINGVRLGIGIGALVMTTGAGAAVSDFHADWIRRPMLAVALIGSLLNIAILIHARHLRNRPAAQWRRKALTSHQVNMERLQWALSLAALVLIGIEEYLHFGFHHVL